MAGLTIGLAFLFAFGCGLPALVVCLGLAIVLWRRSRWNSATIFLVLFAAAGGALLARGHEAGSPALPPAGAFEGAVRVAGGPFLTLNGQRFIGVTDADTSGSLCVYAGPAPRPSTGDLVYGAGRVTLVEDLSAIARAAVEARNCDGQLRLEYLRVIDEGHGPGTMFSHVRTRLSQFLMQSAPGDAGALLSGLVTGDDGALSTDASGAFLSSGTTHITAISGSNFAMIVLILGVLASGAARRSLGFVVAASALVWAYALLVGLQPSAFRAALLATAVLLGRRLGRAPDLLTLTVLLAAIQIAIRPHDFSTLAFQLSFVATVALVLVFDGQERQGSRSWIRALAISVFAAQLATLPVLAARIGDVSGIGLFANLIVGPLAAIAFPLALIGGLAGQINQTLGIATLTPAIELSRLMLATVTWSHKHLPGAVRFGESTLVSAGVLTIATWTTIFWMSGDLRRMARHGMRQAQTW